MAGPSGLICHLYVPSFIAIENLCEINTWCVVPAEVCWRLRIFQCALYNVALERHYVLHDRGMLKTLQYMSVSFKVCSRFNHCVFHSGVNVKPIDVAFKLYYSGKDDS